MTAGVTVSVGYTSSSHRRHGGQADHYGPARSSQHYGYDVHCAVIIQRPPSRDYAGERSTFPYDRPLDDRHLSRECAPQRILGRDGYGYHGHAFPSPAHHHLQHPSPRIDEDRVVRYRHYSRPGDSYPSLSSSRSYGPKHTPLQYRSWTMPERAYSPPRSESISHRSRSSAAASWGSSGRSSRPGGGRSGYSSSDSRYVDVGSQGRSSLSSRSFERGGAGGGYGRSLVLGERYGMGRYH